MSKNRKQELKAVDPGAPETREAASDAQAVLTHSQMQVATYSSNLPPAADARVYEELLPGAIDRLLTIVENEQKIRAENEKAELAATVKRSEDEAELTRAAQIIAAAIIFATLGVAVVCACFKLTGAVVALAGIVGTLGYFFKSGQKG